MSDRFFRVSAEDQLTLDQRAMLVDLRANFGVVVLVRHADDTYAVFDFNTSPEEERDGIVNEPEYRMCRLPLRGNRPVDPCGAAPGSAAARLYREARQAGT